MDYWVYFWLLVAAGSLLSWLVRRKDFLSWFYWGGLLPVNLSGAGYVILAFTWDGGWEGKFLIFLMFGGMGWLGLLLYVLSGGSRRGKVMKVGAGIVSALSISIYPFFVFLAGAGS